MKYTIQKEFERLGSSQKFSNKGLEPIQANLERCYREPSRFYHNERHISEMFELFHEFESKLQESEVVVFSILYHDAIYDPKSKTNEEDSAKLALNDLASLGYSKSGSELLSEFILSTKSHIPKLDSFDCKFFLDLDLSILGKNVSRYSEYSKDIRKEYSFVEENLYRLERAKVLKNFLSRERIYYTDLFHDLWDLQARKNLEWEIGELS
ncbi:MAG: hypothetical protein SFU98_18870 [Leptospiraceae bacterium]|nr:hypothetical protein [Leptospiraceae bacterium]